MRRKLPSRAAVPIIGAFCSGEREQWINKTSPDRNIFANVPERNTGDQILRTTQQHHVTLSAMADNKASMIITVSSIVLTLTLGKLDQPELRMSVLTLTVFTLLALLLAILTVLPKYRPLRLKPDARIAAVFQSAVLRPFLRTAARTFPRRDGAVRCAPTAPST